MSDIFFSITCHLAPEQSFQAEDVIVDYIKKLGFSIGRKQAGSPRGIMLGAYDIQKWRNLSEADRHALHGLIDVDVNGCTALIFNSLRHNASFAEAVKAEITIKDTPIPIIEGSISYIFHGRSDFAAQQAELPETKQQTRLGKIPDDLNWPNDGEANIPKTPSDPRAILREMIDAGLVDLEIGSFLYTHLEAYRRGFIKI